MPDTALDVLRPVQTREPIKGRLPSGPQSTLGLDALVSQPAERRPERMSQGPIDNLACPTCGAVMTLRHNRQTGEPFLGCSRFPRCRGTRPAPAAGQVAGHTPARYRLSLGGRPT